MIIRPVTPSDRELLREGFARMSEESRRRRFLTGITELSEQQLDALTDLDYPDRFAWGATLADRPEVGIGVARYVRLGEEPDVAEVAVTVIDAYQRRGLGTVLLSMLGVAAQAAGITSFRAYVLQENRAIRHLLRRFRARAQVDSPGLLRVDLPLDPDNIHRAGSYVSVSVLSSGIWSPPEDEHPGLDHQARAHAPS